MSIDKEHKKVLAVAIANQSLKNMANSFEAGDSDAAQAFVQSALTQIEKLFPKAKPEDLRTGIELNGIRTGLWKYQRSRKY